jgi:superfamily II DNA or RNA helicase
MIVARYYQSEAEQAIMDAINRGVRRIVVVQATGTGKTVLFSHIARNMIERGRVMILAHRDELIRQACHKVQHITGVIAGVEKAEERADHGGLTQDAPIVVSSIQTQAASDYRRMKGFDFNDFGLLIIDEHHHSRAKTYEKIADYYLQNEKCVLLGVTATADRADKKKLHGELVYEYSLKQAVDDGYLVPIVARVVKIACLNLSRVHKSKSGSGLNEREVEEVMLHEKPLHGVAHATIEAAYGLERCTLNGIEGDDYAAKLAAMIQGRTPKPTLVFSSGVAHAHRLAEIFNRWIPGSAQAIDGTTEKELRRGMIDDYAAGKFTFLTNCGVATEGFDAPHIALVVMARPTTSRALYTQMLGRGTRPAAELASVLGPLKGDGEANRRLIAASGKPHVMILDFVGNSGRHDLMTAARSFCSPEAAAIVNETDEDVDLLSAVDEAEETVAAANAARDFVEANRVTWEADAQLGAAIDNADQTTDADELTQRDRRHGILGMATYTTEDFNPLGGKVVEGDESQADGVSQENYQRLMNMGCTKEFCRTVRTDKQAWAIVNSLRKKRCTVKQAAMMARHGVPQHEISSMNFQRAKHRIDLIMNGSLV